MIGSIGHITLRAVLSVLLIGRGGLSLVAVATGIGWVLVNLFWTVLWKRERIYEKLLLSMRSHV